VSVGDARYGRRDNGLVASAYAAAGDVDPRVGEHLLKLLALEGIAAYLRPSADQHPVTWSTTLPKRPTDRLYVDREHLATARDHLARLDREERESDAQASDSGAEQAMTAQDRTAATAALEPDARASDSGAEQAMTAQDRTATTAALESDAGAAGGDALSGDDGTRTARPPAEPSAADVDRAFAEIVASLGELASQESGSSGEPTSRTTEHRGGRPAEPRRRVTRDADDDASSMSAPSSRGEPEDESSLLDALDTFGADLPDDGGDRFVPPEPPPVPWPSLPAALAVLGVVGGLAVFLKPSLLYFVDEGLAMFLGFTAVVGGFATLVWRLRPGGDDDEADPDDGARV
jgi:hypothetical protein